MVEVVGGDKLPYQQINYEPPELDPDYLTVMLGPHARIKHTLKKKKKVKKNLTGSLEGSMMTSLPHILH